MKFKFYFTNNYKSISLNKYLKDTHFTLKLITYSHRSQKQRLFLPTNSELCATFSDKI